MTNKFDKNINNKNKKRVLKILFFILLFIILRMDLSNQNSTLGTCFSLAGTTR